MTCRFHRFPCMLLQYPAANLARLVSSCTVHTMVKARSKSSVFACGPKAIELVLVARCVVMLSGPGCA